MLPVPEETTATQSAEPLPLYIRLVLTGCGFVFDGFDSDTSWIDAKSLELALNEYVEEASRIIQNGLRRKAGLTSPDDSPLYDAYRFVRIYCANMAVRHMKKCDRLKSLSSAYRAVFLEVERYMTQPSVVRDIAELHNDGAFVQLKLRLKKGRPTPWFLSKRKLHNMLKNKGR